MVYYNVHSHTFTMENAPARFLHLFLPDWVANLIDKATNTKVGSWAFANILPIIGNSGKRYASFLKIGKSKNQLEVFEDLMAQYSDNPQMKFVALTMYMELTGAGPSSSGYEGQVEEVLKVRQQYPDRLDVFLGIDPRWKQSGKELKNTVAHYFSKTLAISADRTVRPFAGLKLYPCTGFYPFEENLLPTFQWAAENKVPVLTHCNYMGGIFYNDAGYIRGRLSQVNPFTKIIYPAAGHAPAYKGKESTKNNQQHCSYFMEPRSFRELLDYFEKKGTPLKICFAHYGSSQHVLAQHGAKQIDEEQLYSVEKKNWCAQIHELMLDFSEVYTDISFALSDPDTHKWFYKDMMDNDKICERLLFGTDFFLTETVLGENSDYTIFKKYATKQQLHNGNTMWDQIAGINPQRFLAF